MADMRGCLAFSLHVLLFWLSYFQVSCSQAKLNLYIAKENLKSDLNLDFGSDIYIVNEGKPAPLLSNPDAFRGLVAPLHPSIQKLEFRWLSFPNAKDIKYTMSLSSSNEEIMQTPKSSIPATAYVPWYDHGDTGFKIKFPCTGKKGGIVDLGFNLNYTTMGTGNKQTVKIVVRRQCYKIVMKKNTTIPTETVTMVNEVTKTWTKNAVIGLITSMLLLCVMIGACFAYWFVQKRNRKLQMKFDVDYEIKMKKREEELTKRSFPKKELILDVSEQDELLSDDTDTPSKPIFTPKRSRDYHRKSWKKHRRRRYLNVESRTLPPAYSINSNDTISPSLYGRGLEQIPEEETEPSVDIVYSVSETNEETPIVENYLSSQDTSIDGPLNTSASSLNNTTSSGYDTADSATLRTSNNNSDIHAFTYNHGPCRSQHKYNANNSLDNQAYQSSPSKKQLLPIHSHTKTNHITASGVIANPSSNHNILEERLPLNSSQSLEDFYSYLNSKWSSQFHQCLLSARQVIIENHALGKGAFGRVHRGKAKGLDKDDPTKMTSVAVKIMIPSSDFDTITTFISEALLMTEFKHKNIMNLLGIVLQPTQAPLIVTPFMKYADLNQFLRSARATPRRHQTLSSRQLINFAMQIACGMEYLAAMKYVHRDLASRNCMVSESFTIKISDFGLARDISKEHYRMNKKTRLPIKWMAIESLTDYIFSEKSDVWSFGVVLWELMTLGKQPYSGLDNQDMEDFLMKGKRLSQPQNCPDEIFDIMSCCWYEQAEKRLPFSHLHQKLISYEEKFKKYTLDYKLASTQPVV